MSRISKIRWRDKDQAEIRRLVKNYNAKLKRVTEKNPENKRYYPDKVSLRELKKNDIYSRKDFNKVVKRLEKFTERGSEKLVTIEKKDKSGKVLEATTYSKYELDRAKEANRIRNIQRAKKRREAGLDLERDKYQIIKSGLKPKKFDPSKGRKSFKAFSAQVEKEILVSKTIQQAEDYKNNYMKAIKDSLGSDGKRLINLVKDISPQKINNILFDNPLNTFLKIGYVYPSKDEVETREKVDAIINEWKEVLG